MIFKIYNILLVKLVRHLTKGIFSVFKEKYSGALARADIHQLNLIMEILGTPRDEFMKKISSESVSSFNYSTVITLFIFYYRA